MLIGCLYVLISLLIYLTRLFIDVDRILIAFDRFVCMYLERLVVHFKSFQMKHQKGRETVAVQTRLLLRVKFLRFPAPVRLRAVLALHLVVPCHAFLLHRFTKGRLDRRMPLREEREEKWC